MKKLLGGYAMKITKQRKTATAVFILIAMLVQITGFGLFGPVRADTGTDQTDNPDIVRTVIMQYKLIGEETLNHGDAIPDITKIDHFKAHYRFDILDTVGDDGGAIRTVTVNDYFLLALPDIFKEVHLINTEIKNNDESHPLSDEVIAQASVIDDSLKVIFTDYVDNEEEFGI